MARPRKEVAETTVFGMAKIGATNVEIAEVCGIDEAVLRQRFSEVLTKARDQMKTKLRRTQLRKAYEGNVVMLIWLGKQMLKQSDKIETEGSQTIIVKEKDAVDTSPRTDS